MPITRPSLQTLVNRISGDIQGGVDATAPLLPTSILSVLARVFAGSCHLLWGYLQWISRQVIPDTAEAEHLERWAAIYGVYRIPATYAAAQVEIAGANGTTLPAGTVFVGAGGAEYASSADETVSGGTATLSVTALVAGAAGTLAVGQVLQLLQPVAGVNPSGTVQTSGLVAGADAETDEAMRTRLLARIQNPPQGGSRADYVAWTLANPDVAAARAWVYPGIDGAGSVGVVFTVVGDDPIPSAPQVTAMQTYLEELAPVTARVVVFAPTLVELDMTIHLQPDTTALRAAVLESLADYVGASGSPGATLYLSQLNEAIASVAGVVDHALTVPAANVVLGADELAAVGDVTWI
jgi:uncharacterized phage protein gp47/JayE